MFRAPRLSAALDAEIDAIVAEEARRATRMMLPFLVLAIYLVYCVLGPAGAEPRVRAAFAAEVGIGILRWVALASLAPAAGAAPRPFSTWRAIVYSGSTWMVGAGWAGIYFAAAPFVTSIQLMELALVATGLSTLALLSMSSTLVTYTVYIAIINGSLALVITRHGDPALLPMVPAMGVMFTAALALVALRNRGTQREKLVLGLELRESALRDALTGLRNRAFAIGFAEHRSLELLSRWKGADRRQPPTGPTTLAFCLIDLDHFKAVNDTHGHAAGDAVLASFATLAQRSLRAQDVVARWGGEEFLVVMEVSDRDAAHAAAERLRKALAANAIALPGGGAIPVTCSVGACLFPLDPEQPDALTWQETLELADGALYRAKHGGRNRTMWASTGAHESPQSALAALRAGAVAGPTGSKDDRELAVQGIPVGVR